MKSTLLKLAIWVSIVAVLLFAFSFFSRHRAEIIAGDWLTDPALEFLAGPEPPALKGLAKRINQFTRVDDAMVLADRAGYKCTVSREEHDRLREYKGLRDVFCPKGADAIREKGVVLILRAHHPSGFMRALEVRSVDSLPPVPYDRAGVIAASQLLAEAKGIEFASASVFADVVADRFHAFYAQNCLGELNPTLRGGCLDRRERRTKAGPPKRDGQPLGAGTHEQVLGIIQSLGLECSQPSFLDRATLKDTDVATVRCETRAFSGQVQAVSLETDARTTVPFAITVEVLGEVERLALTGRPHTTDPLTWPVMVRTPLGKPTIVVVSPRLSAGDFGIKNLATFDAPSQRRIVAAVILQVQTILAAPAREPAVPQLQRLDVAAHLLALVGADAMKAVSEDLSGLDTNAIAAVGLAWCRLNAEAGDCLVRFLLTHPPLRAKLEAALAEARQATPALPDEHPVRVRFTRLARQIDAAEK